MVMSSCNSTTALIVPFLLEKDKKNYENWKFYIKNYLLGQDLWDIVEYGSTLERNWRKKNAAALHAILCSCSLDISSQIKDKSAKDAWNYLAKMPEEQEPEMQEPKERSSRGSKVELTSITPTRDVELDVTDQGPDERNIRNRVFDGFRRLGLKELPVFKKMHDLKLRHGYANKVLLCMCKYVSTLESNHQHENYGVGAALFEATKHGIVEFVTELWKANPSFGFQTNPDDRLAFMVAVQHRRENVFNLIYGVNKAWMAGNINKSDIDRNNILHVAGGLAPDFERAGISSSPALQIQRELQWFKEVERIVPEWCKEAKNNNDQTPKDVFTKSHKELVKEGEKWMRDTASSFIILSILLVTVTFAVSFTVPGGNNQTTGLPILFGKKLFKLFIITDAISFFSASISGLMFLGILTSREDEEDFYVSLPRMMLFF